MTIRQKFMSTKDIITFGKYRGNNLEYILGQNASYIVWLCEQGAIEVSEKIINTVKYVAEKQRFDRAVMHQRSFAEDNTQEDDSYSPYDCDDKGGDWTGYGTSWWW